MQHVTLDNGQPTSGGPMISVTGYSGEAETLPYPEIFHENVVRFRDAENLLKNAGGGNREFHIGKMQKKK